MTPQHKIRTAPTSFADGGFGALGDPFTPITTNNHLANRLTIELIQLRVLELQTPAIITQHRVGRLRSAIRKRRRKMRRTLIILALLSITLVIVPVFYTATPTSGTVSESNPMVTWTGPVAPVSNGSSTCNGPNDSSCDNFRLTIIPPGPTFGPYV